MKTIIGILLLAFTTPVHPSPGGPTYGTKDNPGLVDDPGCKTLIRNQLRDNKQDPKGFTIVYYDSALSSDKETAMNMYLITEKTTGKQVLAIIGLHFGGVPVASPSPSPSPSPASLLHV